jgi:Uncharacterized protein conserved in bacteria (DUF2314)
LLFFISLVRIRNKNNRKEVVVGKYAKGDHVKAEFTDDEKHESEWMWVLVDDSDDGARIVFGRLDSQPIVCTRLHLGQQLAISYELIREHGSSS